MKTKGRRQSKNVIIDKDPDARPSKVPMNPNGYVDQEMIDEELANYRRRKITRAELEAGQKRQIFRPEDSKEITKTANTINRKYNAQVTPGHWITKTKQRRKEPPRPSDLTRATTALIKEYNDT